MTTYSSRSSRLLGILLLLLIFAAAFLFYYLIDRDSPSSPVEKISKANTTNTEAVVKTVETAASRTAATSEKGSTSTNTNDPKRSASEIFGTVTDPAGAPINDAQVFLYQDGVLVYNCQTQSDTEGKYKIPSPPMGELRIYCIKERYVEQRKPLTIEKTSGAVRCDFVLQSTSFIKVFVKIKNPSTPDSDPKLIEQLRHNWNVTSVIATRDRPPLTIPLAMNTFMNSSFGIGNYYYPRSSEVAELVFANGQPEPDASFHGLLEVKSQLPFFVSIIISGHVVEARLIDTSISSLEFYLHPNDLLATLGSIEFTIIDKVTQAPVAFADVVVSQFHGERRGIRPDVNGKVNIQNLPSGASYVQIWSREAYGAGSPDRFFM